MKLKDLKKLCDEATGEGHLSRQAVALTHAARTYLPKLIAVAETARMLADSWRCHDTNFETAVYQDRMFRDLAALEAE